MPRRYKPTGAKVGHPKRDNDRYGPAARSAIFKWQAEGDLNRALQAAAQILRQDGLSGRTAYSRVKHKVAAIRAKVSDSDEVRQAWLALAIDVAALGRHVKEVARQRGQQAGHDETIKVLADALIALRLRLQPELAAAVTRDPGKYGQALWVWARAGAALWVKEQLITLPV